MAQQWLSYVDRAAGPVGIIRRGGMETPAISRREVFSKPSFAFTAKFCIISFLIQKFDREKFSETDE